MKTFILYLIKKFLTPEKLAQLLAQVIAHILRKASKQKKWDEFKMVVGRVEQCCHLFNQCYLDETLDEEDEERIAEAIEGLTGNIDLSELIDKITSKK